MVKNEMQTHKRFKRTLIYYDTDRQTMPKHHKYDECLITSQEHLLASHKRNIMTMTLSSSIIMLQRLNKTCKSLTFQPVQTRKKVQKNAIY